MKRLSLYVICLSICVMACGMPALITVTPESVNKAALINTDTQIPTETSTATMVVCTDGLNIRPNQDDLSRSLGHLKDGEIVTVKLPAIVAEDMGLWYELADGGFVNRRFLCEVTE